MWSGLICFHWSNLFSLAKSIFTGRTYSVKYMMYVPVPRKLIFFSKKSLWKKALFVSVGVAESIFTDQN